MIAKDIYELYYNTPIQTYVACGDAVIHVKLEHYNPTQSVKDRAALFIIKEKLDSGQLTTDKIILDASSGSYACSVAFLGRYLGYPVTAVTSKKLTQAKRAFIKAFGADLIELDCNYTLPCNDYCRQLTEAEPNKYCFLDQLHNPMNWMAHYSTTGPEILADFPNVSAIACSVGSGGTIGGISRYIKEHRPDVKIIAVTAASGTRITGVGAFIDGDYETPPIKYAKEHQHFDIVVPVSLAVAKEQTQNLLSKGFPVGLQTGAVLAGATEAINAHNLSGDVVIVSGDSLLKGIELV